MVLVKKTVQESSWENMKLNKNTLTNKSENPGKLIKIVTVGNRSN